MGFSTVI